MKTLVTLCIAGAIGTACAQANAAEARRIRLPDGKVELVHGHKTWDFGDTAAGIHIDCGEGVWIQLDTGSNAGSCTISEGGNGSCVDGNGNSASGGCGGYGCSGSTGSGSCTHGS